MAFTRAWRLLSLAGIAGLMGSTLAEDDRLSIARTAAAGTARVAPDSESRVALAGGQKDIRVKSFRLLDNGDDDGFADTSERVEMYVTLVNRSSAAITNVTAMLSTTGPEIGCISANSVSFGSMANMETKESPTPFRFSVAASARRTTVNERLVATFALAVEADEFASTLRDLTIQTELDFDAAADGATVGYFESFESSSRTNFLTFVSTGTDFDAGKNTLALSDGYRCQYNDPNGPNSNGPGRTDCFLGFTNGASNAYDWHIHDGGTADNSVGRAYVGTRSMHWGVHPVAGAKRDTTRFKQLEGFRSFQAINLPAQAGAELSFKHQISLLDNRSGTPNSIGETADRAVVAIQLAGTNGSGFGDWIKIYPYVNQYDAQGTDNYPNCTFDPIDDGNDEDDYFDPADPMRRLGPSSTCWPEFVFAFAGDTDWRNAPGNASLIGRSNLDGPGLRGQIDRGTWIEPKFDLTQFRGRRIRLRFLVTSIEIQTSVTPNDSALGGDNKATEDGWYIDDVQIPAALQSPAGLSVDTKSNNGLSECCAVFFPPEALSDLDLFGQPGEPTQLAWPPLLNAVSYDVSRGSLAVLRSGSGDFAAATDLCVANDFPTTSVEDPAIPTAGSGYWYLVRGNNCSGPGTYDDIAGQQPDSRDAEIESSLAACP